MIKRKRDAHIPDRSFPRRAPIHPLWLKSWEKSASLISGKLAMNSVTGKEALMFVSPDLREVPQRVTIRMDPRAIGAQ